MPRHTIAAQHGRHPAERPQRPLDPGDERLKGLAARVVVIDSHSTDATPAIARSLGAEVFDHTFVNHAAQFNWGVEAAKVQTGWVLRIDADEYLDDEGIISLRRALPSASSEVSAFAMRRGVVFQEKRIRFGGISQVFLTRVWRAGRAKVEARWMDEQVLVSSGETLRIDRGAIIDENLNDIGWWTSKHNGYTTRQMIQSMLVELNRADLIDFNQLNQHVRRKRIARERLYMPAPLFFRAIAYFFYRYFWGLGFLDGRAGFLFHFFQGLWNFFLVDVKIYEARQVVKQGGERAFKQWAHQVYGIELTEF